jgi:hypothetical protein
MVEIGEAELTSRNGILLASVVILVNDKRSATLSNEPNAQKKSSQHRIFGIRLNHI